MATTKALKQQNLLGKLTKDIDNDLSITIASNGFVVKVSGRNENDDWASVTVLCNSFDDLEILIQQIKAING